MTRFLKYMPEHAAQIAAGVTLAAGATIGVGVVATGAEVMDHKIVLHPGEAQPSDTTSRVFDEGLFAAEIFGLVALASQGISIARRARNDDIRAKHELGIRMIQRGVVAPLTIAAGITVGALVGIQNGIEVAQTDVLKQAFGDLGKDDGVYVLSNSSTPQSLSASNFPANMTQPFLEEAQEQNIVALPVRFAWHTAEKPSSGAAVQVFTAGLPEQITNLPLADKKCKTVSVAAAEEIGAKEGESFNLEGLSVTVEREIKDGAGMNLLPIIFNNKDYARCFKSDSKQPYSAILTTGEKAQIESILTEIGINQDGHGNVSDRVFIVPSDTFLQNTERTVKSNVDGLVLEAILLAALFAGGALSNDARTELANNRKNNMLLKANGLSWTEIKGMYTTRTRERAIVSSLIAAPLIVVVDAASNLTMAGASMGPNAHTILSVIGLTYGTSKIGTVIAVRREKSAADVDEEHAL